MNAREHKSTAKQGASRRVAGSRVANGVIHNAAQDIDVVRMATAQIEARKSEHHARIAAAAYLRAMQRGFEPGHELEDWLAAEAEIADSLLLTQLSPNASAATENRS
jgi:hypothetical protein